MPDVKVEVAFNAGWSTPAASRTWTDVSTYVDLAETGAPIQITGGRGDELATTDPNSLSLVLDNSDGRFTPGKASSPYYPNVKIGRPIRVTATPVGGSAVVQFDGFVDQWPLAWEGVSTEARARIGATSRTARLGTFRKLKSIVEEEVRRGSPTAYYTMGDPAGSTTAADTSGNTKGKPLTQVGSGTAVSFGNATGPGTDGLTAAQFAAGKYLSGPLGPIANRGFTLIAAVNVTSAPASLAPIVGLPFDNPGGAWIAADVGNVLQLGGWRAPTGGPLTITGQAGTYAVGQTTAVAVAVNSAGNVVSTYQDGALLGTGSWTVMPNSTMSVLNVGSQVIGGTSTTIVQPNGVVAHLAIIPTELDAAHIAAISDSMLNGFSAELSGTRFARYASYAAIAATEISADAGQVPMAHVYTTDQTALDLMRVVESTEEGVVFDARDGLLTFHDRFHRYNAADAFTLDMALQQVEADYEADYDRTGLANDVTAALADGGSAARAFDQASQDDYGIHSTDLSLATTDPDLPLQAANWKVNQYGQPRTRVPNVKVDLTSMAAADQALLLAADVSTRFTVNNIPSQAVATSKAYFVEGYSKTIGLESFEVEFNTSDAAVSDVWTVEDPVLGQYDAYPIAY